MAGMSITETPVTIELPELVEFDVNLGYEVFHIQCCRVDRFFCGRQFHPELGVMRDTPEEEVCECCNRIADGSRCPRGLAHWHCPIPLLGGFVCPDR